MPFKAEKHYRAKELATVLGISDDKVRDIFNSEPGVIHHVRPRKGKRSYRTSLYPESVVRRILGRFEVV